MSTQVKVARIVFASENFFKDASSRVFVELWELGSHSHRTSNARLIPDPQILERYDTWRLAYKDFYQHLNLRDDGLAQVNDLLQGGDRFELQARKQALAACSDDLVLAFNHWLSNQPSFRNGIENWLSDRFNLEDSEIRIAIESDDPDVRRLPWHAWSLLNRFDQAELSIGDTRHDSFGNVSLPTENNRHLRLLVVLGYEGGLDLERDRQTIQTLPNVEAEFLVQPSLQELKTALINSQWDSLYFGGHSTSNEDGSKGALYLNAQGPVEISQLKSALKIAIRDGGLQLGIFNSCDGLGLAAELEDVHFPLSIVMREPVPNVVAQRFLTYFLQAFTGGKPLFLALRQARLLLEDNSEELPYVSWLPAIAHDSSTTPLLWQSSWGLSDSAPANSQSQPQQPRPSGMERATTVVLPHREPSLQLGSQSRTILRGAYEILDSLSSGGFSITYVAKALDLPGQPKCAIKQLKPMSPKVDLAKAREWFELEAQILFELGSSTDRIPTFYARFEEGGEFYLVQEFIDGEELEKELRGRGRLSELETLELLETILEGLEIVHRKNIIHRDIKPSNLMRRKSDGKIVLIDFGAVKEVIAMATQIGPELRRQGSIVGSPGFMAPEQSSGYPLLASDIFSVGAIALRAVTGIAPVQVFSAEGKTGQLIRQDSVQVSDDMANLLDLMTHVEPAHRFASAGEALQLVRQLMQSMSTDFTTNAFQSSQPSAAFPAPNTTGDMPPEDSRASEGNFFRRLFGGRSSSNPVSSFSPASSSSPAAPLPQPPSWSARQSGEFATGTEQQANAQEQPQSGGQAPQSSQAPQSRQTPESRQASQPAAPSQSRGEVRPATAQPSTASTSFSSTSFSSTSFSATSFPDDGVLLSPQQLEQLEKKLSEHLGPMARVTITNALQSARSQQELIEALLGWLPADVQLSFRKFADGVCTQSQTNRTLQYDRNSFTNIYTDRPQTSAASPGVSSNADAMWVQDRNFLDTCQAELAKHIGPIAAFAIKQALNNHSQSGDRDAFIQELASHVNDPATALSFKEFFQK